MAILSQPQCFNGTGNRHAIAHLSGQDMAFVFWTQNLTYGLPVLLSSCMLHHVILNCDTLSVFCIVSVLEKIIHLMLFYITSHWGNKKSLQESLLSFSQMNYSSTKINSPNVSLLDQFVGKTHCLTFHSKYFCWFSITPKSSNPSIPLVDGCNRDVSFERPWSI